MRRARFHSESLPSLRGRPSVVAGFSPVGGDPVCCGVSEGASDGAEGDGSDITNATKETVGLLLDDAIGQRWS